MRPKKDHKGVLGLRVSFGTEAQMKEAGGMKRADGSVPSDGLPSDRQKHWGVGARYMPAGCLQAKKEEGHLTIYIYTVCTVII